MNREKTRKIRIAQRKAGGKKKGLRHYRRSVLMICLVLVCLTGALAAGAVRLHARNAEYKAQEEELEAQIKEQEERAEEVEEFKDYVGTDEYIKDVAEDKLGLVDPNEIIFKPAQ